MKAHWGAPFRKEWLSWPWPCDTTFSEVWRPQDLHGVPDVDILYANPNAQFVMGEEILRSLPHLKAVITPSTGETHLDRKSLNNAGVAVYSLLDDRGKLDEIRASSEFAFLMVLNSLRRLDGAILRGQWIRDEESRRGHELHGKMIGLIGHGRIGKNLERWLRAFGAGVYWNDPAQAKGDCVYQPSVSWLFANCAIVVMCCSLNYTTEGMVDASLVKSMRPGAILVNVSRGEVLLEDEIAAALVSRPDISLWTDVLSGEAGGDIAHSSLLRRPNVYITPHIAGTTYESQEKAALISIDLAGGWVDAN